MDIVSESIYVNLVTLNVCFFRCVGMIHQHLPVAPYSEFQSQLLSPPSEFYIILAFFFCHFLPARCLFDSDSSLFHLTE